MVTLVLLTFFRIAIQSSQRTTDAHLTLSDLTAIDVHFLQIRILVETSGKRTTATIQSFFGLAFSFIPVWRKYSSVNLETNLGIFLYYLPICCRALRRLS